MGDVVSAEAFKAMKRERDFHRARADNLETEIHGLRDIAEIMELKLTPSEGRIYAVLKRHACVSNELLMAVLYADRPDDPPDAKIISVMICKMRPKLRRHGLSIENHHGLGYQLGYLKGGEA